MTFFSKLHNTLLHSQTKGIVWSFKGWYGYYLLIFEEKEWEVVSVNQASVIKHGCRFVSVELYSMMMTKANVTVSSKSDQHDEPKTAFLGMIHNWGILDRSGT